MVLALGKHNTCVKMKKVLQVMDLKNFLNGVMRKINHIIQISQNFIFSWSVIFFKIMDGIEENVPKHQTN